MTGHEYIVEVLRIYDEADDHQSLMWRVTDTTVTFFATCSDTFWWGIADAEDIGVDDLGLLRSCLDDLRERDEEYLLSELFAARKRGMRPMRLWLGTHPERPPKEPWASLDLFLAAGPERDPASEG